MTTSLYLTRRLITYVILLGSVAFPLALIRYRYLPFTAAVLGQISSWDFGYAIAALLAVGGYLLEHYFSRQSSQLERQMERVEQQSHQLLVPITLQWHSLWTVSTLKFIDIHIGDIIKKPEYRNELIRYQNQKEMNEKGPMWASTTQRKLNNPLSRAMFADIMFEYDDKSQGKLRVVSKTELPPVLHNELLKSMPTSSSSSKHDSSKGKTTKKAFKDNRNSQLWDSYEAFIRYTFVPTIEKIAEIIDESGHLMEPVSSVRLEEMFGHDGTGFGAKWAIAPRGLFYRYVRISVAFYLTCFLYSL